MQVAISDAGLHLRREMGLAWLEPGYSTSMPISVPEARDKPGMSQLPKQTTLARKVSNMKSLLLGEAAMRFGINDLPIIFRHRIADMWGTNLAERILGPAETYAENVFIEVYNNVANFYQPFQRPLQVEKRLMHCVWTGDGKRNLVSHKIWVRVNADRTQDSFQGHQVCMPLLYFAYTPPKLAVQHRAPDGQQIAAKLQLRSVRGGNKEFFVPEKIELAVIMGYKFTGPSGLPKKFHGFVEVELEGRDRYIVEVESIEGPVQLVEVNETRKSQKTWIVNNHIDLEIYYYVY
jgi:hypothetical protein